jgi:lysozyme
VEESAWETKNEMSLSDEGLNFIKRHEGFRGEIYLDSAGRPHIGYGHLIQPGENFDKGITEQQATALLAQDVKAAVTVVNSSLRVKVSQTQFDALVSFTFNLGAKNFRGSSLLKNINTGQNVTKQDFVKYNRAGGQVVRGLTIRRTHEYNLYSRGDYGGGP